MIDPAVKGSKATFEQHHLFPRGYLKTLDITDLRQVNQIANFAVVEWPDNLKISDTAPADYAIPLDAKYSGLDREQMLFWHGLPPNWWELPYEEFLRERRSRMANVVRDAYDLLAGHAPSAVAPKISISELLAAGEGSDTEFKSTLRTNLHTGQADEKMHLATLKSIAGFLNTKGGRLIIGVDDNGKAIGLSSDSFPNEDKMGLHLVNLIRDRLGDVFLPYIHTQFEEENGERVLVVHCEKGPKPCFVKDAAAQRFFVTGRQRDGRTYWCLRDGLCKSAFQLIVVSCAQATCIGAPQL